MLHLQAKKQFIALSRRPNQLLWHLARTTAAHLLANMSNIQMPQLDLLHDVLQIMQSFTVFESEGELSELISFLKKNDESVDGRSCLCELKQLFSLSLGLEPVSRLLLGLFSLVAAYYISESLYFTLN